MRRLPILLAVIAAVVLGAACGGPATRVTTRAGAVGAPRLEFATYWTRGFSDPRPVDGYAYRDVPGAHPYVLLGSISNVGDAPAADVAVDVTWADAGGSTVWRASATVLRPDAGSDLEKGPLTDRSGRLRESTSGVTLRPGESADLLVVVRSGDAPSAVDHLVPTFRARTP